MKKKEAMRLLTCMFTSEDQRSIANRLAAQSKEPDSSHHHNRDIQPEAELSKQDPLKPVCTSSPPPLGA
jgi:hypothetical protein